jgi:hypothetical protein
MFSQILVATIQDTTETERAIEDFLYGAGI